LTALQNVTAAILAGGLGTRLRSTVADRPKVLAEVGGKPFLAYLLDQLAAAGLGEVVLCVGYRGEQVRTAFGDAYAGLKLRYSQEPAPLGTGGCLRLAAPLFGSESVLVMNGDSYCQADLGAFRNRHIENKAKGSLVVARVEDTSRFGRVELSEDESVRGFVEKNERGGPGWINAGIYLVNVGLIERIGADRPVSLERDVFPTWIGSGFFGFRAPGQFIDIGTPESYRDAERFFSEVGAS
jgi:NDP-sugar pyrophosphorylase family protein